MILLKKISKKIKDMFYHCKKKVLNQAIRR